MHEYIKLFCEEQGYEFYPNYSGRGMFGKRCVGIVCGNVCRCMIELCAYLQLKGVVIEVNNFTSVCYDNMGKDMIVYFPNIEGK